MNYIFLISISAISLFFGKITHALPISKNILEADTQTHEAQTSELVCEDHSISNELKNNIIGKRIYWIINGQISGWTEYKDDGTYIEDNDISGNYCVNKLLVIMDIDSEPGITVHLKFPKKELKIRDTITAKYKQEGKTILKAKGIIHKIENLEEK